MNIIANYFIKRVKETTGAVKWKEVDDVDMADLKETSSEKANATKLQLTAYAQQSVDVRYQGESHSLKMSRAILESLHQDQVKTIKQKVGVHAKGPNRLIISSGRISECSIYCSNFKKNCW